jgi:hypothetical protein
MPKTSKEAKLSAVPNPSVLPASRFTNDASRAVPNPSKPLIFQSSRIAKSSNHLVFQGARMRIANPSNPIILKLSALHVSRITLHGL